MKVHKRFYYRIYPNKEQQVIFANHFGCCRFVYNYFLRKRIDYYAENKDKKKRGLTFFDTSLMLTQLKKADDFIWLNEVNAQSLQASLRNLDKAYNNFFNKRAMFPKFRKKRSKQVFNVPQRWFIENGKLNIPKCRDIKIVLHRPIEGKPKSVTISMKSTGRYFASFMCEVDIPEPVYTGNEIGIDFGIKAFITTSNAVVVEPPQFLRKSEKQLRRLHKSMDRKQKGSSSRKKAIHKLAVQYEKVVNQRNDFLHKLSRRLVSENQAIYVEGLLISNIIKNHRLAKSISDTGWNNFVDMLKYKGDWYGCRVHKIDRWFPSTKRCHVCGFINNNLTLNDRKWQCPECDAIHDRDLNAAINILTFGRAGTAQY